MRVSRVMKIGNHLVHTLDAKVEALRQPSIYPENPSRVTALETHMSWVFLTDDRAYKLKKPVRYEFLDFSTIEARRHDCEEELRLNWRLAKDVYLDVVPLVADADGNLHLGGDGVAVDWLVKMRRLPAERTLQEAIRNNSYTDDDIARVASLLSRFTSRRIASRSESRNIANVLSATFRRTRPSWARRRTSRRWAKCVTCMPPSAISSKSEGNCSTPASWSVGSSKRTAI